MVLDFGLAPASSPDSVQLTPLIGTVRLAGDEHFSIE
jgi:hypothetical protein